MLLGTGVDLVEISDFVALLEKPGSTFRRVFTDAEWLYCQGKPTPSAVNASLAGHWAAKEALVKAWGQSLLGRAPAWEEEPFPWWAIEVSHDHWQRPFYRIHSPLLARFPNHSQIALSITHDGDYALAWARIEANPSKINQEDI